MRSSTFILPDDNFLVPFFHRMTKPNSMLHLEMSNFREEMNNIVARLDQVTSRMDEISGILSVITERFHFVENKERENIQNVQQSAGIQNVLVSFTKIIIFTNTESSKYYVRPQTDVAHGLGLLTRRLTGLHTAAARKHSLCFSVTVTPVIL